MSLTPDVSSTSACVMSGVMSSMGPHAVAGELVREHDGFGRRDDVVVGAVQQINAALLAAEISRATAPGRAPIAADVRQQDRTEVLDVAVVHVAHQRARRFGQRGSSAGAIAKLGGRLCLVDKVEPRRFEERQHGLFAAAPPVAGTRRSATPSRMITTP